MEWSPLLDLLEPKDIWKVQFILSPLNGMIFTTIAMPKQLIRGQALRTHIMCDYSHFVTNHYWDGSVVYVVSLHIPFPTLFPITKLTLLSICIIFRLTFHTYVWMIYPSMSRSHLNMRAGDRGSVSGFPQEKYAFSGFPHIFFQLSVTPKWHFPVFGQIFCIFSGFPGLSGAFLAFHQKNTWSSNICVGFQICSPLPWSSFFNPVYVM